MKTQSRPFSLWDLFKRGMKASSLPSSGMLVKERALFDSCVYTPFEKAVKELQNRRSDLELEAQIFKRLKGDIPAPLVTEPRAVLFRHIATPNYETRRFFSLIDAAHELEPLFFEYADDKFTSNNEEKHALGKLFFYSGRGKKGGMKIDSQNVIDFNAWNGRRIGDVETLWGEKLTEFHHDLFASTYRETRGAFYDASAWFAGQGGNAANYYTSLLYLFIRHGILFENFIPEAEFTRDVFLPAFRKVHETLGLKPLIVNIEPTAIEGSRFWLCHPAESRTYVMGKLGQSGVTDTL